MEVNLMSDTVTKPTPAMLDAMFSAKVGDDVFGEDPTVNELEFKASKMFAKEAAIFCPSGTMTNQIAIKVHTQPLDEVLCEQNSHIYQYETAGYAYNSGVGINLIQGTNGIITSAQIENSIKADHDWLPKSSLVVLENTCNKGGGTIYKRSTLDAISALCREKGLKLHLDGARLFNALIETDQTTEEIGSQFDSISICLSKGLGAPVGSLLISSKDNISKARRIRKVMGGGMRQAGYLAAAGIYALKHHVSRLKEDNKRAKIIGEILQQLPYVDSLKPVESNIVIFKLKDPISENQFLEKTAHLGIKSVPFGPQQIRFVFHLDITDKMMDYLVKTLKQIQF